MQYHNSINFYVELSFYTTIRTTYLKTILFVILLSGDWNHVKQYTSSYPQKIFLIVIEEIIFHILGARIASITKLMLSCGRFFNIVELGIRIYMRKNTL